MRSAIEGNTIRTSWLARRDYHDGRRMVVCVIGDRCSAEDIDRAPLMLDALATSGSDRIENGRLYAEWSNARPR